MRKQTEASMRAADRRLREDSARRLSDVVPNLRTLSLTILEKDAADASYDVSHVRRIVVAHAPALFELPCCDRTCDGCHDLTRKILGALSEHQTRFSGSDNCGGQAKRGDCSLELQFTASATYDA